MPRFSVNISMMLTEVPFLDRFAAAADLGFRGVDVQFPYDFAAATVAVRAAAAGVEIVLINLPAGDLMTGGSGLAAVPGGEAAFAAAVEQARGYALALGARRVNVLAGRAPPGVDPATCLATLAANLARAAERLDRAGITVMVEPVNGRDVPGFLLQTTEAALTVLDAAGHPNLALQFDLYHRQVMQGDLIAALQRHLPRIAHIQFADNPGRHEPGTGEIAFERVFSAIDALGYAGWVGAEYHPSTSSTAASLGWFHHRR